jgi:hypothetical protein
MELREWVFRTAAECEEIKSKLFSG